MISTQRLTSLAYNIVDGRSQQVDKLSSHLRRLSVKYAASADAAAAAAAVCRLHHYADCYRRLLKTYLFACH